MQLLRAGGVMAGVEPSEPILLLLLPLLGKSPKVRCTYRGEEVRLLEHTCVWHQGIVAGVSKNGSLKTRLRSVVDVY